MKCGIYFYYLIVILEYTTHFDNLIIRKIFFIVTIILKLEFLHVSLHIFWFG